MADNASILATVPITMEMEWARYKMRPHRYTSTVIKGRPVLVATAGDQPGGFSRGGHPHNHLVLNDEDDDRLALVRRLQCRSPGFAVRPQSRARAYSCSERGTTRGRLREADFGERKSLVRWRLVSDGIADHRQPILCRKLRKAKDANRGGGKLVANADGLRDGCLAYR